MPEKILWLGHSAVRFGADSKNQGILRDSRGIETRDGLRRASAGISALFFSKFCTGALDTPLSMHNIPVIFPRKIRYRQGQQKILKDFNNKKGGLRMKIRPLYDRLIVRRVAEEEKTKGGIIIPDTAKDKPTEGEVVAAGKGRLLEDGKVIPMDVKQGDRILFSKYAGNEVKIDGVEYLIMREEDVLGIIEKK